MCKSCISLTTINMTRSGFSCLPTSFSPIQTSNTTHIIIIYCRSILQYQLIFPCITCCYYWQKHKLQDVYLFLFLLKKCTKSFNDFTVWLQSSFPVIFAVVAILFVVGLILFITRIICTLVMMEALDNGPKPTKLSTLIAMLVLISSLKWR